MNKDSDKEMSDMMKNPLIRDRFDKKKGAKDRKEALAKNITLKGGKPSESKKKV